MHAARQKIFLKFIKNKTPIIFWDEKGKFEEVAMNSPIYKKSPKHNKFPKNLRISIEQATQIVTLIYTMKLTKSDYDP